MNIVRNTNTEGTETYRERSRIGSINHRIWSVIAPISYLSRISLIALLLLLLGGWNTQAWAGTAKLTLRAISSPSQGGYVMVSDNSNATFSGTSTNASKDKTADTGWGLSRKQITLYAYASANSNYVFLGWSESANGSIISTNTKISYTTENLYYSQTESKTYYAIFTPKYTIAFNGNGNTSGSMSNLSMVYGTAKSLTNNAFQKQYTITYNADGGSCATTSSTVTYSFSGWEDRNSIIFNGTTYAYTTFDAPYYANTYSDLYVAFGYNKYNLIQHYVNNGKGESRSCKGATPGLYPNQASVNNLTTTAGATVTLYAHWDCANPSVTLPSATKSGKVLEGWYNGSTNVGEAGDTYTPTASVELKAKWIDKYTPVFTGSNQSLKVGGEVSGVFSFEHTDNPEAHITVTSISDVNNGNGKVIEYNAATNKIIAHNAGTATIYFTQNETSTIKSDTSAIYTVTVTKYEPLFTLNKNTLELEQTATLSCEHTDGQTVSFSPEGKVSYNASTGVITATTLGETTMTVNQPETNILAAKSTNFTITVIRKTPSLTVKMNNVARTSLSVQRGSTTSISFDKVSDAEVVVTPVSGAQYASYINGVMTAGAEGTATYRASLAETNTYQAKSVDFSLTVTSAASNHVPFTIDTQARYNALNVEGKSSGDHEWNNSKGVLLGGDDGWFKGVTDWNDKYVTMHFEGIPDKLSFEFIYVYRDDGLNKMTATAPGSSAVSGQYYFLYVEESETGEDGSWSFVWNHTEPNKSNYQQSGDLPLKKTTRYLRFHLHANYGAFYKNIHVTELKYVENPSPESIVFENGIIKSGEVVKTTLVNWCNVAPMTVSSNNDRFVVSPASFGNYENYGSQELIVRFTHGEHVGHYEGDITISNAYDQYTKTIHVSATTTKRPQPVTWNPTLVATGYVMNVDDSYPDAQITTLATVPSGNQVTYTSDNPDVIEVINGVTLHALSTGTAHIIAHEDGDDDFEEANDTKEFTVTELQKQVITWNQNLYGLLTTSGNLMLNATATSGMEITYVSANENVVRVEGNTLIVVGEGETYITASQAGGEDANEVEWLPVSLNNYVIVRNPNSQCNGLALSQGSLTIKGSTREFALNGIPQTLTFSAYHGKKTAHWGTAVSYAPLIVEQYSLRNNLWDWYPVYSAVVGTEQANATASGNLSIDESATKIRFSTGETVVDHVVSNIRVTRPKFMTSNVSKVDQEVETNAIWQKTVTISHSNIDVMKISTKKGLLTLSTSSLGDGCEDFGEDQFVVSYTPMQKDAEYLDTIVITDSKAEPTTITIPIRLHTIGWTQEIENFNLPTAALTTEALPALTATATSGLDVRYESSDEDIVRIVNSNELEIITSGTVTIKAIQDGNDRYYETYAEKSITISKAVPALIAPVGTDVTYLAALSTSSLSDGSATVTLRGVENTPVEGTFVWTNPAQQITDSVGVHSYSVTFTPDDAAYYASATTTVKIKIIAATPEAIPSAANIVYGQKVSASLLSNVGTDGTWAWNTGNNEAVLDAGTYNDLAVHFTPTSGNYTELDATVTLTVEKAAASLSWTTAPTELAFNATSVTYEASSVSDGVISYSIVSGNDYAEINAETGVLTILVPGQTVTVQAAQTEGTNYLAPEAITINVTIGAAPSTNTFTNEKGDGNWYDPANWQSGSVPSSDPDIFVTGDLVIDEDITVGDLTIESTGSVAVISGGTLTVNGTSEARTEYGDVHVMSDGALALGNAANLQVRDFTLDAKLAGKNNSDVKEAAASGQVENQNKMTINGDAYFQMTFDPKGKISFGWYDFVVPFPVNVLNGIFRAGDLSNHLVSGVDFLIREYSESRCSNKQNAWTNFSGTMQPGRVYTVTFNYDPNFDQNVFVFKNASSVIGAPETFATQYSEGSGDTDDYGWNGLGNGMLQHGYITGSFAHMQVYNHAENKYDLLTGKNPTFAIGTSFFVQVDHTKPMMTWHAAAANEDHPLYAPKRDNFEVEEFMLSLRNEDQVDASDHFFISASEEATEAYVIGRDLRKMGTPTAAKAAQMWATKGGKTLCDIETRMENDQASSDLNFFAPEAQTYTLSVEESPEDATLYLTYNDRIIWSLSASPYTIDLAKGMTEGYGLRIVARHHSPSVATGMDELNVDEDGNRKVLIDNMLYIITPEGAMYSVMGEKVK